MHEFVADRDDFPRLQTLARKRRELTVANPKTRMLRRSKHLDRSPLRTTVIVNRGEVPGGPGDHHELKVGPPIGELASVAMARRVLEVRPRLEVLRGDRSLDKQLLNFRGLNGAPGVEALDHSQERRGKPRQVVPPCSGLDRALHRGPACPNTKPVKS